MSKIQKELADATNVNLASGETITEPTYLKRLIKAVADLNDKAWGKLSGPAQDWFNTAADLANKKKDIPAFPDAEEAPARPRRRSSEDDEPVAASTKAYEPVVGDEVTVVTARGKTVVGEVVDPCDKGELVLKVDGEEVGYALDRIESITGPKPKAEDEKPKRRRAAEDDEPAVVEPEVSDTVEITTKRGKKALGNVIEIDDKVVVIKTAAGDEDEYDKDKIESIVVKVKNAGAKSGSTKSESEAPARRSASTDAGKKETPAEGKQRATKDENGGVSVTLRAREIMCEDPLNPMSLEELIAAMKKEKLSFNDNTVKMCHADCIKMFGLLKASKHLK